MALVTIQRSPSPSNDPESDTVDGAEESGSSRSPLRQRRSRSALKRLRKFFNTVRFITKLRPCLSESYFTVKGAALILPQNDCSSSRRTSKKNHGGDMQHHLQTMLHVLRPEDKMKMAVKLENVVASSDNRYLALVSTIGRQDEEESVILGLNCEEVATIGLVIPMLSGTKIRLDGDGGFSVQTHEGQYLFKPVSVQVMWSALQSLDKAVTMSDSRMYTAEGLSHTWISYYMSKIDNSDKNRISQWHLMEGVQVNISALVPSIEDENDEIAEIKRNISKALYDIMMSVDLDEATCISLRNAVEEQLSISLKPYKAFFDAETMRILGQMDRASKITEFMYLGSEWNAANVGELQDIGIGYILNVTKEIDNFFQGMFIYKNIRLYDVPESDLLKHWNKTYDFIDKARKNNSKVLIHCKMGISRSASTTMAFLMKDNKWCLDEAFQFVKDKRKCVNPNKGFMEQLKTYGGILRASSQRHTFHNLSGQDPKSKPGSLDMEDEQDFLEAGAYVGIEPSELPLCKPKNVPEEEWIAQLRLGNVTIPMEEDLETGSRSADSMEESLPDIPSPTPEVQNSTKTCSYHFDNSSQTHSGQVAGAEIPYESSSEESDDQEEGILIPGAHVKPMHTQMSSSVPLNTNNAFKDDFSWIKQHSDSESAPSSPQFEAPVFILASDVDLTLNLDPEINNNFADSDSISVPVVDNQQTTNVEMDDSSPSVTTISKSQIMEDLGINTYYTKEAIPWSSGTVQKIRDELVHTTSKDKQIFLNVQHDIINANTDHSQENTLQSEQDFVAKDSLVPQEIVKVSERTTPGMKCSHSCSELLSLDIERPSKRQCPVSVYDKEQIEWTEGIVRKTKMEIEERANLSYETGMYILAKPIQRSASLKEATEIAKAKRAERRKTCSPIVSLAALGDQNVTPSSMAGTSDDAPRPLEIIDTEKRRSSMPETTKPKILISGVTLDESSDVDPKDITVYRYGSEEVPLESGIVQKHKQGYETRSTDMVLMDSNDSEVLTSKADIKDSSDNMAASLSSSYIPNLQNNDNSDQKQVVQKVTSVPKSVDVQGQGQIADHPVRLKRDKCPFNKEEMDMIKDMGSMLSHKTADDNLETVDSDSPVINVVRNIERKTQDKKPNKKIVIIDSNSKKSKFGEKCKNDETKADIKSESHKTLTVSVDETSACPLNGSEISDRSELNLDLKTPSATAEVLSASPESVPKSSHGTSTPVDQSAVKLLLERFEKPDSSPVLDNSKPLTLGVCVAKMDSEKTTESDKPKSLVVETIVESDEDQDKHLLPEYVEMRNNLNHVSPAITQRNRPKSSDIIDRQSMRTKSVSDGPPSHVSQRHSVKIDYHSAGGDEFRRVRRSQMGASHPLTRLGASKLYNTM